MRCFLLAAATVAACAALGHGQTIDPYYDGVYSATDLGTVAGVPGSYGGITFKSGDPNTLLLGGAANGAAGAIYEVPVLRDGVTQQVVSFGTPTLFSTAPFIDGGLAYGPGDVLFFTTYSNNTIGQIKPGSVTPDKTTALGGMSVGGSVGTLAFVPAGFAGAGQLKIASYSGNTWHSASIAPDGTGAYDITVSPDPGLNIGGGPEGIVYIADTNPLFSVDSVLISEYSIGRISSYEIDADGDPIPATRRDFLTGLSGAEGATIDPLTGDFLFSTFGGGNRIVRVQGFLIPEPATLATLGVAGVLLRRRR